MARTSKVAKRKIAERDEVFPSAASMVYDHTQHDGFATIPKVMPLIFQIMDEVSKDKLSMVYFDLFCFVFNTKEGYLTALIPKSRAYYAGLHGQRATYIWIERMRKLKDLGFILTKEGESGEFHHVMIVNPLRVVHAITKDPPKHLDKVLVQTYISRLREAGTEPDSLDVQKADPLDFLAALPASPPMPSPPHAGPYVKRPKKTAK